MTEEEKKKLKNLGLYERSCGLVQILFQKKFDKAGVSYLNHLERVSQDFVEEPQKSLALMHDVLEDTDFSQEELEELGYSSDFIASLELLTNRSASYEEYIDTLIESKQRNLLEIKMKDLLHNMDLTRLKQITKKDLKRTEKYMKAYLKIIQYLGGEEI